MGKNARNLHEAEGLHEAEKHIVTQACGAAHASYALGRKENCNAMIVPLEL